MTNGRNVETPAKRPPTVVVGVDGSESSIAALRWAARQAELTGAELRAVISWELPSAAYWVPLPNDLDLESSARSTLAAQIAQTLGPEPKVPVTQVVAQGHPAPTLVGHAADADLLVLGSRGHGELASVLLGSVSEHCVTHAHCPVVVIKQDHRQPTPGGSGLRPRAAHPWRRGGRPGL